jgi:hypothetical protein
MGLDPMKRSVLRFVRQKNSRYVLPLIGMNIEIGYLIGRFGKDDFLPAINCFCPSAMVKSELRCAANEGLLHKAKSGQYMQPRQSLPQARSIGVRTPVHVTSLS